MPSKEKSSAISFPMTFFLATLVITVAAFLGFSWYVWESAHEFEVIEKRGFRLYEVSSAISRANETLTMSARMAATTGDIKWEEYYNELDAFLVREVKEAESLAPDLFMSRDWIEIKKVKKRLSEIEKKALELVRSGVSNRKFKLEYNKYFTEAEALLFSREYEDLKLEYSNGLTRINSLTHEHSNEAIHSHRMLGLKAFISVVSAMPVFFAAWLGLLKKINYYISRRREAKDALEESERKYRSLVTEINEGFFICDKNGVITFANSAFARIYGFESTSRLIGTPLLEFIDPAVRKKVGEIFLKGLETGQFPGVVEARIFRKDGSAGFVQMTPGLYMEGRSVIGIRGILTDITERKAAEEELVRSRNDLSILNNISSVINRTMDMEELCSGILTALKGLDIFRSGFRGGIFLLEGERLRLVSQTGNSEHFIHLHSGLRTGECLCGIAAGTGESIISRDSSKDARQTIMYTGMQPHGSIIIPLKARAKVMGVLFIYMPQGFEMDERDIELLKSVANQAGVALDNSKMYEDTKKSSLHDPLTGIANRRMMNTFFEANFKKAQKEAKPFSIIMLDIDHFKKYNDAKGHAAGDRLLVEIAKLIVEVIRGADLASRYGGEEFMILLAETDLAGAAIVAEKIRRSAEAKTEVTASLGVSCYSSDITSGEELIKKADAALYESKSSGRNRVTVKA
ncbi:MAG: diguanylate cyclase [Nitrospirae bacterium]|nr:diguanylate cyclase [Nitrospirota bacterium]